MKMKMPEGIKRLCALLLCLAMVFPLIPLQLPVKAIGPESTTGAGSYAWEAVSAAVRQIYLTANPGADMSSELIYDCGNGLSAGKETSYMTIVEGANADHFSKFKTALVNEKYTKKSERSMASNGANGIPNAFADFRSPDGKYKVYTYYLPRYSEIRIIVDSQADTVEGYKYTAQTGKTVTPKVVLWGLPQAPDGHNVSDALNAVNMVNYGAMTVMLMPDNSLFIHDGGDLEQWSDQGCADFLAFCRELTGTTTEKMIINTWALSHAHHDHFRGFWRFLSKHHDQFDLKNVMYNIDRERTGEKYDITGAMKLVREVYPNVRYYKPHTGEQLTIAGVTVDILYTQEDRFVPNGNNELIIDGDDLKGGTYRASLLDSTTQAADFNDTSTVMKFTFNPGATNETDALLYGDLTKGTTVLMEMHASSTLVADVVTVPHHGQNDQTALMKIAKDGGAKVFLQHQHKGLAYGGDGDLTKQDMYGTFVTKVRDNFKAMFPEMNKAPGSETANYQVFWAGINTVTIDLNTLATTTAPRTATGYYKAQNALTYEYTGWDITDDSDYLISTKAPYTNPTAKVMEKTPDFNLELVTDKTLISDHRYVIRKKNSDYIMSYTSVAKTPGTPNRATSMKVVHIASETATNDPNYYATDSGPVVYSPEDKTTLYMNHSYRDQTLWIMTQRKSDGTDFAKNTQIKEQSYTDGLFGGTYSYSHVYLWKGADNGNYWYAPNGQDGNDPATQYRYMFLKHWNRLDEDGKTTGDAKSGRGWMATSVAGLQESSTDLNLKRYIVEAMSDGSFLIYWRNGAGSRVHFLACDEYGNWGEKIYTDEGVKHPDDNKVFNDLYPNVPDESTAEGRAELEKLKVNLYHYNEFDEATNARTLNFSGVKDYNVEQGITKDQVAQIIQENIKLWQTDQRRDLPVPCSGWEPKVGFYYLDLQAPVFDTSGNSYSSFDVVIRYVQDDKGATKTSFGTVTFYLYERKLSMTGTKNYEVSMGTGDQAIRDLIVPNITVTQSFSNTKGAMTANMDKVWQPAQVSYSTVAEEGKYWLEFVPRTYNNQSYTVNVNYRRTDGSDILVDKLTVTETVTLTAPETKSGMVALHSDLAANVLDEAGNYIKFTANGKEVELTLGMLTTADGKSVNTAQEATYENLTVTYRGQEVCNDFTLSVSQLSLALDNPPKGEPGHVEVGKQSTTTEEGFKNSGIANIQLSASGTVFEKGVDLILIMDLSGSMLYGMNDNVTAPIYEDSRMYKMQQSLKEMVATLQQSGTDVRIAMSDFGNLDHYVLDGSHIDSTIRADQLFDANYSGSKYTNTYEFSNHLNYIFYKNGSPGTDGARQDKPFGQSLHVFNKASHRYTGKSEPTVYTGSGRVGADAFVDVNTLFDGNKHTADMGIILKQLDENVHKGIGTNYDVGLEYAYHLGYAIQQDNLAKGENREVVCIFMSDGAPMQYNYFTGHSDSTAWKDWLQAYGTGEGTNPITSIQSITYDATGENAPTGQKELKDDLLKLLKAGTLVRPEYLREYWTGWVYTEEKYAKAEDTSHASRAYELTNGYFLYRRRYDNASDVTFFDYMNHQGYELDWDYLCRIAWANGIEDFDYEYYQKNPQLPELVALLTDDTKYVGYERVAIENANGDVTGHSYYKVRRSRLIDPGQSESQYFPKYTGTSTDFFEAAKSLGIDSSWDYFTQIAYKNRDSLTTFISKMGKTNAKKPGQEALTAFVNKLYTAKFDSDNYTWGTFSPYAYFYNAEGKNWWAEAIKGDPDTIYPVINKYAEGGELGDRPFAYNGEPGKENNFDINGDGEGDRYVSGFKGLGIELYSILFASAGESDDNSDSSTDDEGSGDGEGVESSEGASTPGVGGTWDKQLYVPPIMQRISSNNGTSNGGFYFLASNQAQLTNAFKSISATMAECATRAYYVDTIGQEYDLFTGQVAGQTPSVKVMQYILNDKGERVGDPVVMETITFEMTNGVLTAAYSDLIKGQTNILQENGLVQGRYVLYNTTDHTIDLYLDSSGKKFVLQPETFFWIIGNISSAEVVLEYQVYLTGSREGEVFTGGVNQYFDTNEKAELFYVNYLGNQSKLDTVSPRLSWKTDIDKDLYLDKTVSATADPNKFTLTLEAYSVGETIKFKTTKPADIVLALDQSASMYTPKGASTDKYTYTENQGNNTALTRYSSIELNDSKAAHLGYYVAQSRTANRTTSTGTAIYDWFIVQYNKDNGQWYYARVTDTTIPVTMRTTDVEAYVANSSSQYFNEANGFNRIICSGASPIDSLYYYESQYAVLYESVNRFVSELAKSSADTAALHRIAIAGFASPFYDGISYYDGSGLYIDGNYYLYDTDYMYMGYATTANANGYMLYVSSDDMYNAMAGDLPDALENITWSRTVPAGSTLVRLDPNKSNKGASITAGGRTFGAGNYFASFAATGKQLDDRSLTDQQYANALMDVGVGAVNSAVTHSIETYRTNYMQTSPAVALDMAEKIFEANPSTDRDQIVVLFTDGVPTVALDANRGYGESQNAAVRELHYSGFAGAKDAINKANVLKTAGVEIYTIGTSGADAAVTVNYSNATHGATVNNLNGMNLLKYISSNYLGITATHTAESKSGDVTRLASSTLKLFKNGSQLTSTPAADANTYAKNASDGQFSVAFNSITTEVTAPSETTVTNAILKEIISDYFDLDITSVNDIKVYTAAYNGKDDFAEKSSYANKVQVKNLTVELSASQNDGRLDTVNISGFDFKKNYLSTTARNGFYGCKLIIEVPVRTRDGFWGGNNVPTNDPYTAVYSGDKIVDFFPMPEANVPLADAKFTVNDKTVYSGQVIQGSELLTGAITVAGKEVTVNADGAFIPQEDWMDDHASISWGKIDSNRQEPTKFDTQINSMAPGNYTFVLDVAPNTSSDTNLSYNPSNIVGAFATAKSLEDTGHVFVKAPMLTFKDATTDYHTSAATYNFPAHLERVEWGFMTDTVDTSNAPDAGTAPGLQLTYTPDSDSLNGGNIVTDTMVNVTVANGTVDLTSVSTFDWINCNHSGSLGTINTHPGDEKVHEFWVHVSVSLEPDTVVIDFGLDVVVDVLGNDPKQPQTPTLNGIGTKDLTEFGTEDVSGTYGKLSKEDNKVRYSLDSTKGMQMATEEVFGYQAKYSDMILSSSTVTIIPATSIYFEDNMNFVTYHGAPLAQWQECPNETVNGTQDQDRPGLLNGLDADSIYGYDGSYAETVAYSGGAAHKVILDESRSARASFTFTGTGFDIVSLCSKNTGTVLVNVFRGEITDFDNPAIYDEDVYVVSYFVDTYYGYTYQDGKWIVDENASEDTMLYQVPVIKADLTKVLRIADDPNTEDDDETEYINFGYGTYTVEIFVGTSWIPDLPTYTSAEFYLDAIRIYNPAGVSGEENEVIHDAYIKDGEGWPVYQELRNLFISQKELSDVAMEGIIFIDASETPTIKDYIGYGPNNEIYLNGKISEQKQGQGVAFTLDERNYAMNGLAVDSVHIGLRGLTDAGTVEIYKDTTLFKTITLSTTDMYYDITSLMNEEVTIKNSGTTPVAISNLKVTHKAQPTTFGLRGIVTTSRKNMDAALEIYTPEQLVTPIVTPERPALSFNGMVCYNVFFSAENLGMLTAADLGLAVFDSYDPEGTVDTAKDVIMGATLIDGQYMIATNGIHAKYLGDTQYFRVFAKKTDGTYEYSKMVSYSAVDYAKNALAKSDDVKLKQLVVAMLNYGTEAQKFFGYKVDDLMNKDLTTDHQALLAGFNASSLKAVGKVDASKVGGFASNGGFTKKSPAISFEGAFEINYFFTPANVVDGDMKLYFWNEDTYNRVTELTAENADKVVNMTEYNGVYTGNSDEIAAKYLDKTLYVAAVYESDGVTYCSGVLPYSIAAYCQKPPAGVQELATAAAIYGCTAKQYFSA